MYIDCMVQIYTTIVHAWETILKTESVDNSDIMSNKNEVEDLEDSSCQILDKAVASLTPALLSGTGFTLSEVRNNVS